jgi:hypothetical protein
MTANSGGIDWTNDEAVVRAVYLEAIPVEMENGSWRIYDSRIVFGGVPLNIGASSLEDAWKSARRHPNIRAFERAHNPAYAKPAPPASFDWGTATAEEKVKHVWPRSYALYWNKWHVYRDQKDDDGLAGECKESESVAWEQASSHPSVLEAERNETAALRVEPQSHPEGQEAALPAKEFQGGATGSYPELSALRASAGKGFEEWWGLEGKDFDPAPNEAWMYKREPYAKMIWSAALASRGAVYIASPVPPTNEEIAAAHLAHNGMVDRIAEAKRKGMQEALEAVEEYKRRVHLGSASDYNLGCFIDQVATVKAILARIEVLCITAEAVAQARVDWKLRAEHAESAFATLKKASLKVIAMNIQEAEDRLGDRAKAEEWACVRVLREALSVTAEAKDA